MHPSEFVYFLLVHIPKSRRHTHTHIYTRCCNMCYHCAISFIPVWNEALFANANRTKRNANVSCASMSLNNIDWRLSIKCSTNANNRDAVTCGVCDQTVCISQLKVYMCMCAYFAVAEKYWRSSLYEWLNRTSDHSVCQNWQMNSFVHSFEMLNTLVSHHCLFDSIILFQNYKRKLK